MSKMRGISQVIEQPVEVALRIERSVGHGAVNVTMRIHGVSKKLRRRYDPGGDIISSKPNTVKFLGGLAGSSAQLAEHLAVSMKDLPEHLGQHKDVLPVVDWLGHFVFDEAAQNLG